MGGVLSALVTFAAGEQRLWRLITHQNGAVRSENENSDDVGSLSS
jgi:hypothetical protein